MKRNHTNNRVPKSGTSPYVRHAKREYKYGELLTIDQRVQRGLDVRFFDFKRSYPRASR